MMECQRIFGRWKFWVIAALALGMNVFLFIRTQERTYGRIAGAYECTAGDLFAEYRRQLGEYTEINGETALLRCMDSLEREEQQVSEDSSLEYYVRKYMILPLLSYEQEYPKYLEQVRQNAGKLGSISIFKEKGSFSSRNLKITAEDFAAMEGTVLRTGNFYGVRAILDYQIADGLILLLMLYISCQMLEERRKGLWGIVRLAGGGRWKLSAKRLLLFCTALFLCAGMLYGSMTAASWTYFGKPDLSVPAQSLQELEKLPLAVSMGEFLVQYLAAKTAGLLLIALLLWIILSATEHTAAAMAVAGIAAATEYTLFMFLPVQSIWNLLKYCNIFSYFYMNQLYQSYLNMNLFGYPVNARELLLSLLPVFLLLGSVTVLAINAAKRPECRRGIWTRMEETYRKASDRMTCRLHGFGMELYKALIVQKGIIVLALLFWMIGQIYPVTENVVSVGKTMLEYRLEEWEGPIDDPDIAAKMAEEKAFLDEAYAAYEKKIEACERGELSAYELDIESNLMRPVEKRREAYDQVMRKIKTLKALGEETGRSLWLVNDRWIAQLLGTNGKTEQRNAGLLAVLFLILLLAPIYASEEQAGVKTVIRGTGRGRGRLILRKECLALVLSFAVYAAVYGTDFRTVVRCYGIHGLNAPIQSISWMSKSNWCLTVRQLLCLVYMLRFLALWSVGQIVLLLSQIGKTVQSSVLAGIVLLLLPSALWATGVDVLRYISVVWQISAAEQLNQAQFKGVRCFIPFAGLYCVGLICAVLSAGRWMDCHKITEIN